MFFGGDLQKPKKICGHCAGFENYICIEKGEIPSLFGQCKNFVGSMKYRIKVESYNKSLELTGEGRATSDKPE